MAKRVCKVDPKKTKTGKPCGAVPLKKGTVVQGVTVSGKWCIQHDEDVPDSARIGGAQPGSGRPRVPTATEVMRQLVEEHVCVVLNPYFETLGYRVEITEQDGGERKLGLVPLEDEGGAKLYGESRDGVIKMSQHRDLGAQLAAADKILDRVFGRPKQATELTGPNGGPIEADIIGIPSDQQFHEGVAKILQNSGAAGEQ